MLQEVRWVDQEQGEPQRRWFFDCDFDLFVWQDKRDVVGFQLCYDKPCNEQALSWQAQSGYCHSRVDNGPRNPGRHNAAPVLVPGGRAESRRLAHDFLAKSLTMEPFISRFIYAKLLEYGQDRDCPAAG